MRRIVTLIMLTAFLLSAVPAYAAAPVATGKTDVQLWPGAQAGETVVVIASIVVPDTVKLPVTVQFPIPQGMTVDWSGEILGTEAAQDIQHQPQLKTGKSGQYAEFELTKSHQAQVELSGGTVQSQGGNLMASFDWVQSVGAGVVSFSVRMPAGTQVAKIEPSAAGSPQRNTTGETLYTLTNADLKTGEKQKVSVTYAINTATQAGPGTQAKSASGSTIIAVLVGALVIAAAALIIALRGQGASSAASTAAPREARAAERREAAAGERRRERRPEPPSETPSDDEDAFRFDD